MSEPCPYCETYERSCPFCKPINVQMKDNPKQKIPDAVLKPYKNPNMGGGPLPMPEHWKPAIEKKPAKPRKVASLQVVQRPMGFAFVALCDDGVMFIRTINAIGEATKWQRMPDVPQD